MNSILKALPLVLLAANLAYPLTQGPADGSAGRGGIARPVKNQEALAPMAAGPAERAPKQLACLRIGGLAEKGKGEALSMLGQLGRARAFESNLTWQVRFGPWPESELEPLQALLEKWGGAKAEPCLDKEREEWENSK